MSASRTRRDGPSGPPGLPLPDASSLTDESESDNDSPFKNGGNVFNYKPTPSGSSSRAEEFGYDQLKQTKQTGESKPDNYGSPLRRKRPKEAESDDEEAFEKQPAARPDALNGSGGKKGSGLGKHKEEDHADFGYEQLKKMKEEQNVDEGNTCPRKRQRTMQDDDSLSKKDGGLSIGARLMRKAGYVEGSGLGKAGQGMREALAPAQKADRGGLGYERMRAKLNEGDMTWEPGADVVEVEEIINWIPSSDPELDSEELAMWEEERRPSAKKDILDDEDKFCDLEWVQRVLRCKSALDVETGKEIETARSKANPFEATGKHFFMNRAALKMANMDAVFDFMFTNPLKDDGKPLVDSQSDDLLYFADVCAGPGGFTEYVLWKKQWHSHGFGFTLEGKDDFKLYNMLAGPAECFDSFHGPNDSNSVYNAENLDQFAGHVHRSTLQNGQSGVHFMMADGGFSVAGQENIQEILSKRLYLCQFLCALMVVREGGHFACKLFDLFTPFSVGLVYLMYRVFDQVCIHKPNSSRPANSERYIVCKGLRPNAQVVREYLHALNCQFDDLKPDDSFAEAVPLDVLEQDKVFYEYIKESNEKFAEIQCLHLSKTIAFITGNYSEAPRQSRLREDCIRYWQLPDLRPEQVRRPMRDPGAVFKKIVSNFPPGHCIRIVGTNEMESMPNFLSYRAVFFGANLFLILGLGKDNVFVSQLRNGKFEGQHGMWEQFSQRAEFEKLSLQLPAETLLVGEFVEETVDKMYRRKALHIVDAYCLGKENVSLLPYDLRMKRAKKFAKSIVQCGRQEAAPCAVRVKSILKSSTMIAAVDGLQKFKPANYRFGDMMVDVIDEQIYPVHGMHFIQITKEPWKLAWSKSQQNTYCFNPKTGESCVNFPKGSVGDMTDALTNWKMWRWNTDSLAAVNEVKLAEVKNVLASALEFGKTGQKPKKLDEV